MITYYKMGDVDTVNHTVGGASREFVYSYDDQHQLLQADTSPGDYTSAFTYDQGTGRLATSLFDNDGVGRNVIHKYNAPDPHAISALENAPPGTGDYGTYAYDDAGNTITRDVDGVLTTFVYDGEDRLRKVIPANGNQEVYYYDHSGERFLAVEKNGSGAIQKVKFWFGGTETHFDGAGLFDKSITRLDFGQPVARIEKDNETDIGDLKYVHHSTLQHMLVSLDAAGTIQAGFIYGPFGEVLDQVGVDVANHERRFNGKDLDSASGLSYYGARYYDNVALQWTQGDPLYRFVPDVATFATEPRRANLYSFSVNNPLRYFDPDGLDVQASFHGSPGPTSMLPSSGSPSDGRKTSRCDGVFTLCKEDNSNDVPHRSRGKDTSKPEQAAEAVVAPNC